jgi:putative PIG3 family NAD(P)H quinone oxidoreductase
MALCHGGGYAEYCCANEGHCLSIPDSLTFVEAAAFPETYFTVWYNVFMRCGLAPNEVFLVHGGSSGIGTTAIQLAKAIGCTVITTAGSDAKCRFCEDLGADLAINYQSSDWAQAAAKFAGDRGVDVLLDMVVGPYMQKNLDLMARDGRYAIIAFLGGTTAKLNMRAVSAKRLTISGSTLRPQTIDEKTEIANGLALHVLPLLETEEVKPIIHATFPLADARAAHELMESSNHMGKIVLQVGESS